MLRSQGTWKTWVCVVLAGGMAALSALQYPALSRQRQAYKLDLPSPKEGGRVASELRLPLGALFVFRSLAIDYLWIRADNLKNAGQYFDALHLARMICALQPHIAKVWDFQAWNMAYNISVSMPTCPERWHWVSAGYQLLRDEGLRYNPQDPLIFSSLAWIFQHKMGSISDDCNRYYKKRLVYEMSPLMDGPGTLEELSALAGAARSWEELRSDAGVVKLVEQIRAAEGKFKTEEDVFRGMLRYKYEERELSPECKQVVADHAGTASLRKLDLFLRARELRQTWKMEPSGMLAVSRKYGAVNLDTEEQEGLDWRLPWTHAIYWAVEGLKYAKAKDFDESRLHRVVYQSLQDLYHNGRMQMFVAAPPEKETQTEKGREVLEKNFTDRVEIFFSQDLRMLPAAYQETLDIIQLYQESDARISMGITAGSINMASTGIMELYLAGHKEYARKFFQRLKERLPNDPNYKVTLEEYVRKQMKDMFEEITPKYASDMILGLLQKGYMHYAMDDSENATISEKLAEQIYEEFQREYPTEAYRLGLPSMAEMRWVALKNFVMDDRIGPNVKGLLLGRMQVERPDQFQRLVEELKKQREQTSTPETKAP